MNRCEHGQKITKFCVTEHCHHKEAAGCDYCIRKYHFHLTNTVLLSEADLEEFVKRVAVPSDTKYKCRSLQEAIIDYLRSVRNSLNGWLDQAEKAITERLSHPLLRKNGLLSTYNRLKYKEYRKLNAKDLRTFNEFIKLNNPQEIKKEQIAGYYQQVQWTKGIIGALEHVAAEITRLPQVKEGEGPLPIPQKSKLNDVFEMINREFARRESKSKIVSPTSTLQKSGGIKFQESSLMKRRMSEQRKDITPSKDQVKNPYERKTIRQGSIVADLSVKRMSIPSQQGEVNEALTNIPVEIKQPKQEKEKRLKRRRSSIDDKLDLKFGAAVDEKAKENEQRKKRLLDNVLINNQQRKVSQQKAQKKQEAKAKQEVQSNVNNLLSKKYGKKEEMIKISKVNSSEGNRIGTVPESTNQSESQKSDSHVPDNTNYVNFMETLINNILPPLPPGPVKATDPTEIIPKVVKIPVVMKDATDEVQSPILKSRKKQSSTPSPFGITLNSASGSKQTKDEIVQKKIQGINLQKQFSKPVDENKSSPVNKSPQRQAKEDLIVLEHKQKNSLLLFSQALRSQSDKAIELLKASLKYSPNNLSAAQYLSYLYLEGGRAKECLQVCESILVNIEDTPQEFQLTLHLHNNRAAALNMLGRYSESIMILQKCLRSRRKHYFYKNLADAYFCLGIPEKAAMNYQRAVKLDSEYDEAFYNLAVTQFIQEEYSSAMLNIREALRIDKGNEAYEQLQREIVKRQENIPV